MKYGRVCPKCFEDCSTSRLTDLLYTWEKQPTENELIETTWHRDCFLEANCNKEK